MAACHLALPAGVGVGVAAFDPALFEAVRVAACHRALTAVVGVAGYYLGWPAGVVQVLSAGVGETACQQALLSLGWGKTA